MVAPPPYVPPAHLRSPVNLLVSYLTHPSDKPFFASGDPGTGRGHAIDHVLRAHGFVPFWLFEPAEAPTGDLDGNDLFPVYDLDKPTLEVTVPSIVFVDTKFALTGDFKGAKSAYFAPPQPYEIEDFLTEHGYPKELANGNSNYGAALMAMRAWDAAKVHVGQDPIRPTGWDQFRAGGDAPVDDKLLAYYAGENLPIEYKWWNLLIGLRREIPAWLFDRGLDEVRARWPEKVRFPALLTVKKPDHRERAAAPVAVPTVTNLPPKAKNYHVDWD